MPANAPDPKALRALARRDPALAALMKSAPAFPGFPTGHHARRTHFESLASAIVSQQLSGKAAATIWGRVLDLAPKRRLAPEHIDDLADEQLRGAGLSGAKTASIRDLALKSRDGTLRLQGIARASEQEVIERLVQVRGIGVWSAQMFLMFKLGRLDVLAPGDLGLQEGLRRLDGLAERPSPAELEARGADWAPLRSVASWYLWRATEIPEDRFPRPAAQRSR
ncbi:DNA-3-methyladenine glycosylase family protein [Engelhardtia mirabilis]|uniref:DNA-3-methyladenine glycosylase II n=1 Tax=Engelhardtia mirabilis TaxID=2528011 RepID=A0A518BEU4_9BACT|nr:DNA-3-methyladenine glycosylase [Planctomycetes bacterium Pla133]QDU99808.1 DNA-3-methyladenine glycosylase [Planctomycetes bacterium Pla86]